MLGWIRFCLFVLLGELVHPGFPIVMLEVTAMDDIWTGLGF